jgi:hypothetical protein
MLEKVQTEPSTRRDHEFPIFGSIRRFVAFYAPQKLWPALMESYVRWLITDVRWILGETYKALKPFAQRGHRSTSRCQTSRIQELLGQIWLWT